MFCSLLRNGGFEVHEAGDGEEGWLAVRDLRPDTALVDIGLPRLDGYELARRVRRSDEIQGVRLIALTGYGRAQDRRRAQQAGFDDHLTKPVDWDRLVAALNEG